MSYQLPEDHGEFSCIFDLDNESTGFMSPVQQIPHVNESQIFLVHNT